MQHAMTRERCLADLRAQIKAIEEGSSAYERYSEHACRNEADASGVANPNRKHAACIETFQSESAPLQDGCLDSSRCANGQKLQNKQAKHADADCDQAQQAFAKIQRLLCIREHASTLLRKRLIANGFDEHVAFEAVQRAVDCGLVCDERYADVLVRSRLSQGKGLRGIAFELEQADIDPCSVPAYQDALSNENGPDELTRALRLLDAKPPKAKRTREAAYRKLVQKGYTSSVAASAARIFEERCRYNALSAH